jgi:small-conductance mechanosensitive channel
VENILVEFQEAASSSLNYLIYVNMKGEAADSYYTLGRLLQRICVDTCNEHGWVIPFEQLTVHAGSGFGVDKLP